MRRMLTGFVVAVMAAVVPALALADNQKVADQIKYKLSHSGQMSDYKIGIKYQDGTAWLFGRVASDEQMNTALRLTFQIASVNRVVNDLTVAGEKAAEPAEGESPNAAPLPPDQNSVPDAGPDAQTAQRPERLSLAARLQSVRGGLQQGYADRVPSSYTQVSVRPVADEEPQPMPAYPQARPVANGARGDGQMAMMQPNMRGPIARPRRPIADVQGVRGPGRGCPGPLRPALHAQLCLAKLRCLSKLRSRHLSEAVFTDGMAVYRPVLSVSPGAAWMAEGHLGMG